MNKWKTKFSHWKFDKKILLLVTVSILIVTLTVAGVSLTFSIASMKEQSVELLQMQNNTVAESFKGSMDSYKEIVLGTIMDDSVQNYCRQVQKNELKTADIDAVYSKLENLNNMYESLNFAAIVSSDYKSYYYRGKGSLSVTQFEEVYPQAYERSKYAQKGTLKVSYNNDYYNDYYKGNRYTLSLYYPLYDTRKVSDARGLLCMNFDDPAVQRMPEDVVNTQHCSAEKIRLQSDTVSVTACQLEDRIHACILENFTHCKRSKTHNRRLVISYVNCMNILKVCFCFFYQFIYVDSFWRSYFCRNYKFTTVE